MQGLDPHERTIYIGTFTKSLFPGLRIGYMVLPPPLVAPMTVGRTLLDGHSAPIPQLTLARFIEGGHFGAHVRIMRAVYAERRDVLARLVRQHLAEFVSRRARRTAARRATSPSARRWSPPAGRASTCWG